MTSAWLVFAVALLLITSFSVLVGKCIRYGLGPDPELSDRPPAGPVSVISPGPPAQGPFLFVIDTEWEWPHD